MSEQRGFSRVWLLVGAVVAIVAVVAVAATWWAQPRVERYVETALEAELEAASGSSADVGSVSLSLRDAAGTIENITIASPEGFDEDVLDIERVELRLSPDSLTSDTLVVRDILVTGARLNVEQRGTTSNLEAILAHMRAENDLPATAGSADTIIIDRFVLDDAELVVTSDAFEGPQTVRLDPVTLTDLGRSAAGMSYDEATDAVLEAIVMAARDATGRQLSQAASEAARERIEDEARQRIDELLE